MSRRDLREVDISAITAVVPLKKSGRQLIGLCPFHSEKTPSFTVDPRRGLYHCFGCGEGGDVIRFVEKTRGFSFVEAVEELSDGVAPAYPAGAEHVYSSAARVLDDARVIAWLRSRGLDPEQVELNDSARVLCASLPWARSRRGSWIESGHRLLVAMFDAYGRLRSVRARAVSTEVRPKTLPPAGFQVRGVVMASLVARRLLRGEEPDLIRQITASTVVIVEGEPDFLAWASRFGDAVETVPAVLGIVSGSWTPEIATRVPSGFTVTIRTHDDDAGRRYAAAIAETLRARCEVYVR